MISVLERALSYKCGNDQQVSFQNEIKFKVRIDNQCQHYHKACMYNFYCHFSQRIWNVVLQNFHCLRTNPLILQQLLQGTRRTTLPSFGRLYRLGAPRGSISTASRSEFWNPHSPHQSIHQSNINQRGPWCETGSDWLIAENTCCEWIHRRLMY